MDRSFSRRNATHALTVGAAAAVLFRLRPKLPAAEIDPSNLPVKIQEPAKRVAPSAKWSSADKSKEDKEDVYELIGADGKGRATIVNVAANGKVTETRVEIRLTEVPKSAWQGVAKKIPTFEAVTVYEYREGDDLRGPDDGDLAYEISGFYQTERKVILAANASGEITESEMEVAVSDVPKTVMSALKAKMPKFRAITVYEVTEDGSVTGYQFEGKRPKDKRSIDVFVSADGKEIDVDDEG
jgi:hypothetical protein